MSAFDKLARPIQKWVRLEGWHELRKIQVEAIHAITENNSDLIISAATAGGKTEAAFLPLISQLLTNPANVLGFDLLYVSPLKALITDQAMRLEGICREIDIPIFPWHGDVPATNKARALKHPGGILMITPESLEALFIRRGLEIPRLFQATRTVIIDELHSLLDTERGIQLQSLLTRLENVIKRPIRRIGLSATLGDLPMAGTYLRPDQSNAVKIISVEGGESEIRLKLYGYVSYDEDEDMPSAKNQVCEHLFDNLRGNDNLVFAGARRQVEIYADSLRELSDVRNVPQEFFPHHANLSRDHRTYVEKRLKDGKLPTTAICTSTLELGIDIGEVKTIAQIGAPFSVSALRQRLGRSGRREGQAALLRQYVIESRITDESSFVDQFRLGLMRSIAMIELLLDGWCEPPKHDALHLSTLVHQILSVIAERGGAKAELLYRILCQQGPFRQIKIETFLSVLRAVGQRKVDLIEQTSSGLLLLGAAGERLVGQYKFYAVFNTVEEYILISDGKELGTLPINNILSPGMNLIFSGCRWSVEEVHDVDKIIIVKLAEGGVVPVFHGEPGIIHDRVIEKMFDLFESDIEPTYLDRVALGFLCEARRKYYHWGISTSPILKTGHNSYILATRCGTVKNNTLAMALIAVGATVEQFDGFLQVTRINNLAELLKQFSVDQDVKLFVDNAHLEFEKFHKFLTLDLLRQDALSERVEAKSLRGICRELIGEN